MRVTLVDVGSPYYTMGLANALASFCDVTVVHSEGFRQTCDRLAQPNVVRVAIGESVLHGRSAGMRAERQIFQIIAATEPDVLHVQETFQYSAEAYSAFLRFPTLVVTIHDAVAYTQTSHAVPGARSAQARDCWRRARLIVHTARIRDQLIADCGIAVDKIDTIPHGELGSLYQRLAAREDSVVERDPYGLLFFGNIRRHRGLGVLLEAFRTVNQEIPKSRLLISGYGSARLDQYDELIERSSNVEIGEPTVSEDRIYNLFRRSNVVVLPYTEASESGVAAIGLTTGTIVVATNVGSFPELITDGKSGILVDSQDPAALGVALVQLLQDSRLQDEIRRCAMTQGTTTRSWMAIAESTMYTYRVANVSRRKG